MEYSAMAANRGALSNLPYFSSSSNTRLAANSVCSHRSHMQYYGGAVKVFCGKKTKVEKEKENGLSALREGSLSDKRRMKLLELVSGDLSVLSHAFIEGNDADNYSLAEEVRGQILSEALRVVMLQLEQVKAQRRQRKIEMKAQKKTQKKLQKKKKKGGDDFSSESSDSVCEVVDTAQIRMTQPAKMSMTRIPEPPELTGDNELVVCDAIPFPAMLVENPLNMAELHRELGERKEELGCRQVQVCMGGKCKKLGSEQVLAAFEEGIQKSGMGSAVEAVACKCMGKCRTAPNVRVQNDFCKELHMGFAIGDVDLVLNRHFTLKLAQI